MGVVELIVILLLIAAIVLAVAAGMGRHPNWGWYAIACLAGAFLLPHLFR